MPPTPEGPATARPRPQARNTTHRAHSTQEHHRATLRDPGIDGLRGAEYNSLAQSGGNTLPSDGGLGALRDASQGRRRSGAMPPISLLSRLRRLETPQTAYWRERHAPTGTEACSPVVPATSHIGVIVARGTTDDAVGRFAPSTTPDQRTETRNPADRDAGHPPDSPRNQKPKSAGGFGVSPSEGSASHSVRTWRWTCVRARRMFRSDPPPYGDRQNREQLSDRRVRGVIAGRSRRGARALVAEGSDGGLA